MFGPRSWSQRLIVLAALVGASACIDYDFSLTGPSREGEICGFFLIVCANDPVDMNMSAWGRVSVGGSRLPSYDLVVELRSDTVLANPVADADTVADWYTVTAPDSLLGTVGCAAWLRIVHPDGRDHWTEIEGCRSHRVNYDFPPSG